MNESERSEIFDDMSLKIIQKTLEYFREMNAIELYKTKDILHDISKSETMIMYGSMLTYFSVNVISIVDDFIKKVPGEESTVDAFTGMYINMFMDMLEIHKKEKNKNDSH